MFWNFILGFSLCVGLCAAIYLALLVSLKKSSGNMSGETAIFAIGVTGIGLGITTLIACFVSSFLVEAIAAGLLAPFATIGSLVLCEGIYKYKTIVKLPSFQEYKYYISLFVLTLGFFWFVIYQLLIG